MYDSCEYHHYGYRTTIDITVLDIMNKSDYLEKKKPQILKVMQDDEYQLKQEVLKNPLHPGNLYITGWKIADFIKVPRSRPGLSLQV